VLAVAAQLGEEAGDTESLGVAGTALEAPNVANPGAVTVGR